MLKSRFQYITIALIGTTCYFVSQELFGPGLGWIVIAIGLLAGFYLAQRFSSSSTRIHTIIVVSTMVLCAAFMRVFLWYKSENTYRDLSQIQGIWEASTPSDRFVMEVKPDSTYITVASMPSRVAYIMRASQDSLILIQEANNVLAFRLHELTDQTLRVSLKSSEMTFHKRP